MKLAIMQPYLFPYIGYWQLINSVDKFVVYDDVSYIKQGWINRNNVLSTNGALLFTLPLRSASSFKLIKDITINDLVIDKWETKFFKTLEQNYKKAPYFENTLDILKKIFSNIGSNMSISRFNVISIKIIIEYLGIDTIILDSSTIYNNSNLKAEERVIDIVNKEGADTYINLIGGIKLYDKEHFKKNNISLRFQESILKPYKQFSDIFIPNLSIIDVLMFNSKEKINKLLNSYHLV